MRTNTVRTALRAGLPQVGTWLSLASPMAARLMARTGFNWLTLDIEHSPADWETASIIFGCIADAGCVPLARVPVGDIPNVKRALDAGAFGIVAPMVNTRAQAEEVVAACRYAPMGRRSVGGGLHTLNFDCDADEYYARANEQILVVVQAEHVEAVENREAILSVPGIDAMFVGPNDLLSSMHRPPAMETDDPEFVEALRLLRESAVAHGVAPGIHTGDAPMALRRLAEGWQFVAVASELSFMVGQAAETARVVAGADSATGVRY